MYLEAVFRFYVLLNHFVGHFFFGLVRFGSFSNTIYRNLALALSKLHINVDITVGFFVGQKNYRLHMKRSREEVIGLRLFKGIACAAQLGDIAREVDVYDSTVRTGNEALDTILTEKSLMCSGEGIVLTVIANGAALDGLITLIESAGATVVGAGIVIEKAFQPGGELIRSMGVRVESLARIASMSEEDGVKFVEE